MIVVLAEPGKRVVYAGRHRLAAPPGAEVVGDWEATPRHLLPLLNQAALLVLLDPLSFPYESLRAADRDVPVATALPQSPVAEVEALLGSPLLDHLGPGDRVACGDGVWEALQRERRWPGEMRLQADPDDPAAVAEEAIHPGAVGGRPAKEEGRLRARALAYLLSAPGGPRRADLRLLDVGGRAEPWRHLLPAEARFLAVPARSPMSVDDESVETASAVGLLGGLGEEARLALVAEMWRVTRPGGRLAVVDDVVPIPGSGHPCPFARGGLPRLLLEATGRRVVLERVRSLRFPREALHRGAGVSVVKVGEAQRW